MNVYPQLTSGALGQFPIAKVLETRTVVNQLADGSKVKLADSTGGLTGWRLQYAAISDAELAAIQQLFQACEGSLGAFTFVDPVGNLLAWSEDLANAVWQPDPLLAITAGVADPFGDRQGFHLVNSGGAVQGLNQTLNAPGEYLYSLSVYAKAAQPTGGLLSIGAQNKNIAIGVEWNRFTFTGCGDATASSVVFAIQCGQGAIDIFGPQVDAQPAVSAYKRSSAGGVYQNARFQEDTLTCTATAPNQNSVTVNILYANHL